MSMFKRFRDAVTGTFVTKEEADFNPDTTVSESTLRANDLTILKDARKKALQTPDHRLAYLILEAAIHKVLDRRNGS